MFNVFFKSKVEDLANKLIKDPKVDPLSKLSAKVDKMNLYFNLKTVSEKQVRDVVHKLKNKRSTGFDGISAELLKLGGDMLIYPLTYIINSSIVQGKFPTKWKQSKITPLHKKEDRKLLKNYRPVALLCVAGMVCERMVAIQIEDFFGKKTSCLEAFSLASD